MPSKVFAISLRTHYRENLPQKLKRLFKTLEPEKVVQPRALWALKLHFGELGSHVFIRPHLVRVFVDALKEFSAKPFLTDGNTLYVGGRLNSVDHLETAVRHGFGYEVTGAPLIISDGLRGGSEKEVSVNHGGVGTAWVAADFAAADGALVLTHFKGHEKTGFGGALKNLGMGAAARRGKLAQHAELAKSLKITTKKCDGCGSCIRQCAYGAAYLISDRKAYIDPKKCVGCARCITACPREAISIPWNSETEKFMQRMMEYAKAALDGKGDRALYVNFITGVSPLCDCANHSDAPIVADLGILAGRDPVALDLASAELVNAAPGLPGSALPEGALPPGTDKWSALNPNCHWRYQLEYAQKIGLGSLDYQVTWLPEVKGVDNYESV